MKNLMFAQLSYLLIAISFLCFSCSEEEKMTSSVMQYDNKPLKVESAIAVDYGMSDPLDEPDGKKSHQYMELHLSDVEIVYNQRDNAVDGDDKGSFLINLSLYYPDGNFTNGNFLVVGEDYTRSDIEGKAFSDFSWIAIDEDGGEIGIEPDGWFATTDSTVEVTKDGSKFTLTFNFILENGKKLTGTYQGEFTSISR